MPEPDPKPTALKREPSVLSSEYYKARKELMLWAGVLFIWELVGINLESAKEAGGNVGAVVKSIRSPQAVPWVLLVLVSYFLFRFTVEWFQCNRERRNLRAARLDFFFSWTVALTAYALYIVQTISRVQFADFIKRPHVTKSILWGGIVGMCFWGALMFLSRAIRGDRSIRTLRLIMSATFALIGVGFYIFYRRRGDTLLWYPLLWGFVTSTAYAAVVFLFMLRPRIRLILRKAWRDGLAKI